MEVLDNLMIFKEVVEQRQFAAAAQKLKLSNGSVTNKIKALEQALGTQLLNRTTRRFATTEAGDILYQHALKIAQQWQVAEAEVKAKQTQLTGQLTITAPPQFGNQVLIPLIAKFNQQHPQLNIRVKLSTEALDFARDEIDLAIRGKGYFETEQWDMATVQMRTLLQQPLILCASPRYCQQHGFPERLSDLKRHQCVIMDHAKANEWRLLQDGKKHKIKVQGNLVVSSVEGLIAAALADAGIILTTRLSVQQDLRAQRLVRVLPDIECAQYTLTALYPKTRFLPVKTRQFIDFVVEYLHATV